MSQPSHSSSTGPLGPVFYAGLFSALVGFGVFFDHTASIAMPGPDTVLALRTDLERENASAEVVRVAHWAIDSQDHAGMPFVVVDKADARLFAFDSAGRLQGSAPILLGAVRGDGPAVPATPAGRFVADTRLTALGDGIVWANAEASVSLHGVSSASSPGRGRQRLASEAPDDKRISDGSLHVADEFYLEYFSPLRSQASVAYVLPEVLPLQAVFTALTADPPQRTSYAQPVKRTRSPS